MRSSASLRCVSRQSAWQVRSGAERLAAIEHKLDIEYGGYLSNHGIWVVVPRLRLGVTEDCTRSALLHYNENVKVKSLPERPGHVAPTGPDADQMAAYPAFVSFFDDRLREAIDGERSNCRTGRNAAEQEEDAVRRGLNRVVAEHLPKVSRGVAAAAFHPILHLGLGLESCLPATVSEALAYLYARSWKAHDTFEVNVTLTSDKGTSLSTAFLTTLRGWCTSVAADGSLLHRLQTASDKEQPQIGGFQKRALAAMSEKCLLEQSVDCYLPILKAGTGTSANTEKLESSAAMLQPVASEVRRVLEEDLDELFLFTAAALAVSKGEFFVLHGLTSLWSVRATIIHVPDAAPEVCLDLMASWLRAYFAAYVAQGLPGAAKLLEVIDCFVQHDIKGAAAIVREGVGETASGEDPWELSFNEALAQEDEHVLKAYWMLIEMQGKYASSDPKADDILLDCARFISKNGLHFAEYATELSRA